MGDVDISGKANCCAWGFTFSVSVITQRPITNIKPVKAGRENMKVNFNRYQKFVWVALPLGIMLNPMTIQIYLEYVIYVLEGVGFICIGYVLVFMLWAAFRPQAVHIPSKTDKTAKAGKFVTT